MTRIGAGLSTAPSARQAATEAAVQARAGVSGVDLAFVFASAAHLAEIEDVVEAAVAELRPRHLVGCVAEGVVGREHEVEDGPAVAVWAASLPGAAIRCFHAEAVETDDGLVVAGFPEIDGASLVALLVDPFTFPLEGFLERLNEDRPGLPLVGGIAAAGGAPSSQALIFEGEVVHDGAVGAIVSGVPVRTLVSQGCAPIGREAVITSAEGNIIYELAGEPALERLKTDVAGLSPEEQLLAARGLLVGLVIDENKAEYERGDFLMRGLIGADEETGALAVGAPMRVGQTLRFHVRDAASADDDLREALAALDGEKPAGALLFTCNGRGTRMFPHVDHDARVVAKAIGAPAVAGFFCGGEIGPVGGRAFLHGFTATLAVFLEGDAPS